MQILHNGEGHWLTISTIGIESPATVNVYDSKYYTASAEVKIQVASILHTEYPQIKLLFQDVQKQVGSSDCGVFALAYATALILGIKPEECLFDQNMMRKHLISCFEDKKISAFPLRSRRKTRKVWTDIISVFCLCRMPECSTPSEWVECSSCCEWFHVGTCVQVPQQCITKPKMPWHCPHCS